LLPSSIFTARDGLIFINLHPHSLIMHLPGVTYEFRWRERVINDRANSGAITAAFTYNALTRGNL